MERRKNLIKKKKERNKKTVKRKEIADKAKEERD